VAALQASTEPLADLIRDLAALRADVDHLKRSSELFGNRGFSILLVVLAGLISFISGIAGVLLTFYLKK
jgi:hypothetical protein